MVTSTGAIFLASRNWPRALTIRLGCVAVVMHKDKEENSHHDSHYRSRELAALAAYDHHHLDGEMFLQVSALIGADLIIVDRRAVFTASFGGRAEF